MEEKCIICGKPAKYISEKYQSPLCEECALKEAKRIGVEQGVREEFIEVDDYYTQPCEEMEDVIKEFILEDTEALG